MNMQLKMFVLVSAFAVSCAGGDEKNDSSKESSQSDVTSNSLTASNVKGKWKVNCKNESDGSRSSLQTMEFKDDKVTISSTSFSGTSCLNPIRTTSQVFTYSFAGDAPNGVKFNGALENQSFTLHMQSEVERENSDRNCGGNFQLNVAKVILLDEPCTNFRVGSTYRNLIKKEGDYLRTGVAKIDIVGRQFSESDRPTVLTSRFTKVEQN